MGGSVPNTSAEQKSYFEKSRKYMAVLLRVFEQPRVSVSE
jgi:hypothetical protein